MIRLGILLILSFYNLVLSQTLDPRYPNILSGRNRVFFIGREQGDNLKYKAEVTNESNCCINLITGKEMKNFFFKLTIENVSNLTYYVKPSPSGMTYPLEDLPNSLGLREIYNGGASVIIQTNNKTTKLMPGGSMTLHAYTNMKNANYYPITESQHDSQLSKNPKAFYPNFVAVQIFIKGYSSQQIIDINKNIVNLHGPFPPSNPNTNSTNTTSATNTFEDNEIGDFIDDLASDFDKTKKEESIDLDVLTKNLPTTEVITNETEKEDLTPTYNYDQQLCTSLINEYSTLLSEVDNLYSVGNNYSIDNYTSFSENFTTHLEKKENAIKNNKLSPACLDDYANITNNWTNQKNQEIDQLMNEFNDLVNSQSSSTYPTTPAFAPATMTPTFQKNTPSMTPSKFGKAEMEPISNPKLKYTK